MSHCSIFARPVKQWHVDRTEREREREGEGEGESRGGGEQLARREVRVRPQARGGSNMDFSSLPPNPWDFGSSAEKILAPVKLGVKVRPQDRGSPNIDWLLPT